MESKEILKRLWDGWQTYQIFSGEIWFFLFWSHLAQMLFLSAKDHQLEFLWAFPLKGTNSCSCFIIFWVIINVNKQVKKRKKERKRAVGFLHKFIWSVRQTWLLCGLHPVTWLPSWLPETIPQQLCRVVTTHVPGTTFFFSEKKLIKTIF